MGNQFSSATLDDATVAMIKRKTRMKSSEITNWYSELKVSIDGGGEREREREGENSDRIGDVNSLYPLGQKRPSKVDEMANDFSLAVIQRVNFYVGEKRFM